MDTHKDVRIPVVHMAGVKLMHTYIIPYTQRQYTIVYSMCTHGTEETWPRFSTGSLSGESSSGSQKSKLDKRGWIFDRVGVGGSPHKPVVLIRHYVLSRVQLVRVHKDAAL